MQVARTLPFLKSGLIGPVAGASEEITSTRQASVAFHILKIIMRFKLEKDGPLLLKDILDDYNVSIDGSGDYRLSSRGLAGTVRNQLNLKTRHTREGGIVVWDDSAIDTQCRLFNINPKPVVTIGGDCEDDDSYHNENHQEDNAMIVKDI